MERVRNLLVALLVTCFASVAYGAALSTSVAVGSTTAVVDTTFTQTFTWSWNVDQNGASSSSFDFSKCKSMTRTFDADITGASTDAQYELYACNSAAVTDRASCRQVGGPYTEHSEIAMGAGMFTKPYGMIHPSVDPTGTDVATVTLECVTDGYVYDEATAAWVASDKFEPGDSSQETDDSMVYFNDFTNCFSATAESGGDLDITGGTQWVPNDVGTLTADPSTYCVDAAPLGILRMIGDATDDEGNSLMLDASTTGGYAFLPAADRTITAEFRCTDSDWDAQHWFLGLFETIATEMLVTNGALEASKEFIGFHYTDGTDTAGVPTLMYAGGNNTNVEATSVAAITALTDATYYRFKVKITDTDKVSFYIDDVLVGKATGASAYTAPMYISIGAINNEAGADTFDCDYVRATQTR